MPKKPTVSLRKPPPPPPPTEVADSFVTGRPSASDRQPPTVSGRTQKKRGTVQRAGGGVLRKVTVYLPPDRADALARYCFDNGLTISDVAGEGVLQHIDKLVQQQK